MINLLTVPVGARIKLASGDEAEVLDNPGDGIWLFGRLLSDEKGQEVPVFGADIVAVIETKT